MDFVDLKFEKERELYALKNCSVVNCLFEGEEDGESPLKECSNINVDSSIFSLRYPLWHLKNSSVLNSTFTDKSRAGLWYGKNIYLSDNKVNGVKFLRECKKITINDCDFETTEPLWKCKNVLINNSRISGEYAFFSSSNLSLFNVSFSGKYSFQYCKNLCINSSVLNTKDAFWHCNNAIIKDSEINGEYIGWYSQNLTFINCHISGTQPFCYAKNLRLINCSMDKADFAFEYSSVKADIKSDLISIKNPLSGYVKAEKIGEIIIDEHSRSNRCKIEETKI